MSPIPLPGTNRDLLVMHRRSVRSQLLCCATVLAVGSACASAIPVGMPNGGVSTSSPPDVKPSDPRSADPRAADPRSPEPRSTEPTKTDRRMPEPSASGGSFGGAPGAGTRIESANADVIMPRLTSWPVRTAEHVDLWLHAFALLSNDTSMLPDFAPRYRDSLIVVKNRATVFTSLDSNYAVLSRGLAARGRYARAQLLPLEFSTWDVFRRQAELFLSSSDPSRSSFAAAFPSAVDREWLRTFLIGVNSEQQKFYAADYSRVIRSRSLIVSSVDSLWTTIYRRRFERFLTNTNQGTGDIYLALPLAGEGRLGIGRDRHVAVVVPFPARLDQIRSVLFVFAHEVTGSVASAVVADFATAADRRNGVADGYVSIGRVRAGERLISLVAPELSEEYMRYYLTQSGVTSASTMPISRLRDAFAARFTLPSSILNALTAQIESVLRGN